MTTTTSAPTVTVPANPTTTTTSAPVTTTTIENSHYPDGVPDGVEPSGESPPTSTAMPGYRESYVDDFGNSSALAGWTIFQGPTIGDSGGEFARSHVTVSGGLLQLNAWQDPAYANAWATGGVCQCDTNHTYGAYFVRSRLTGPGPTEVEMLMAQVGWPPEVDFNETRESDGNTVATLHFTAANLQDYRRLTIDLTQWHTWGVVWTPTSVTYTLDGQAWGTITTTSEIPDQPMHLDLTQQTWCSSGFACPTRPESTEIDWVAEYTPTISPAAAVGPFAANSAVLSTALKAKIGQLAVAIKRHRDTSVALVGYGDNAGTLARSRALSRRRAVVVEAYLKRRLSALDITGVTIAVVGKENVPPVLTNTTLFARAEKSRVVPWIN